VKTPRERVILSKEPGYCEGCGKIKPVVEDCEVAGAKFFRYCNQKDNYLSTGIVREFLNFCDIQGGFCEDYP